MLSQIFNPQNYYWNPWAIPNFINGLWTLSIGLFLFAKRREKIFSIVYFCGATWILGYGIRSSSATSDVALFWAKLAYSGVVLISTTVYHFTVAAYNLKDKRRYLILAYFISSLFLVLLYSGKYLITEVRLTPWGYQQIVNFYVHPFFLFFFSATYCAGVYNFYILYKENKKKSLILELQRLKFLIIGFGIAGFGALDYLADYGIPMYQCFHILVGVGIGFFTYGIIRYKGLEIDTVIHRTVLWLLTLILSVFPAVAVGLILKKVIFQSNIAVNFIVLTLYLLSFVWYYTRLRPRIDHFFRRRKYEYQTILGKVAEKIATTINIEELASHLLTEVCEAMYLRNSLIYVLAKDEKSYYLLGRRGYRELGGERQRGDLEIYAEGGKNGITQDQGKLACDSVLYKWLNEHRELLEKEQVEVNPLYSEIKEDVLGWFKERDLELIIPLVFENKITAILGLGKKENLQAYAMSDLELLKKLGQEAGVTVYNALHHEDIVEKERMDEEMKMGRQIQMSLLPQEIPQVRGLNIQGLMQPAKEIGGDYYDFITLPDKEKLAVVIGDVSGKGVAAGLLMSMAKATIHTLSQEGFSPKEILLRTNQFLNHHIGGQKFMTLLYLLWQPQSKSFAYSSAGHEHILIYRNGGEVEAIISGGFMLGMIPEIGSFLEEREIRLQPHDKILLYTDGVTEAESQNRDRFSLDRLKEVFKKHSQKPANELMLAVKDEVYTFIGDHPQYDDITLVVMEAT